MTIRRITITIQLQLTDRYLGTEIESFVRILFRHYLNMTPAQVYLSQDIELSSEAERQILTAISELKNFRPIQYIIGETEFYGLRFVVTPDVLIPRPETEELVDWIVHEYNKSTGLTIVDIGTGSGCIAIALATNFPHSEVWAVDISETILTVAQRNAAKNNVNVNFLLDDALKDGTMGFEISSLDVIVSNPPYITLPEKQQMQPNVLEYEPHVALFAPEYDPLIFYKRITSFGKKCLKDGGRIFFEINEGYSNEIVDVLKQSGYSDIIPRKDINDKWRMISASILSDCATSC